MAACSNVSPSPFYTVAEQREADLRRICETRSFSLGRPSRIRPTPDGRAVLFLRSGPRDRIQNLYEFDTTTGKTRVLLTAESLLKGATEELSVEEKARRERQRITTQGITAYDLSEDGTLLLVPLSGKLYAVERAGGAVHELRGVKDALDPRFSPDGRRVSYVANFDLYAMNWSSGEIRRLTTGGTEDTPNGLAEFVAQEEMDRDEGYWWSPDGKWMAYQSSDLRGVEELYIPDPAHPNRPPQGWRYPRAGTKNAKVGLSVVPAGGGSAVPVQWDVEHYPYLARVVWEKNAPLTILVQSRNQHDEVLLSVDPAAGTTRELLREHDEAWLNLFARMPLWLETGEGFLWLREADGYIKLWLHDAAGKRVRELGNPSIGLRAVTAADAKGRRVYVTGSADATETHVYTLSLDRGDVLSAFDATGLHSLTWSKNFSTSVTGFSSLRARPEYTVYRADGVCAGVLPAVAEELPFRPNVEITHVGSHGEFDAAVVRPRNFQHGRKYPVIVDVYGGPSEGVVHKDARAYTFAQWFADQGFIVVSSDNRGVRNRGRAWERAIYGNFADVPLDDQITALRALGARYPELDLSRVGITGWSFGGYMSALATIRRGDVFHAGAAGAAVVDWSDYDTHYTERYLNTPQANADGYARSSILRYVDQLHRPLLLIHGTADDNVYFGHALRLADALFRAGKRFELLPLAGYTHLLPDPAMRARVEARIAEFFRRHLRGE